MTYYLIGTGNTAYLLAKRMEGAGHVCVGLWGRNTEHTEKLAKEYQFPMLGNLTDIHDGPDVCLLAVADNAIAEVAKQLQFNTTTLIHFAGSVSMGKLSFAAKRYGVIWPLYSIRKEHLPVERKFPCIVEGVSGEAISVIRSIAKSISDTTVELSGEQRQWLHAGAVLSNNFTTYLLNMAEEICWANGIPFTLLHPILQQLVKGIQTQSPRSLQTGPARRGDEITMEQHLQLMAYRPHWQEVYKALSAAIKADFSTE